MKSFISSVIYNSIFSKKYLCKAPFLSIYINPDGTVTPCCFNKLDVFGNIYEMPLISILKSNIRKELQHKIKNNIFPVGCKSCETHVKCGNWINSGITKYNSYKVRENKLSVIEFELSHKCNLRCIMCKLNDGAKNYTPVYNLEKEFTINKQISPILHDIKIMYFYGGEPFQIEEYFDIWNNAIDLKFKGILFIQTNGTILNNRIHEMLTKASFLIGLSIDSFRKETYEKIRKGAHIDTVLQNIPFFKEISKRNGKNLTVAICPMTINWKDIPEIVKYCNENNLNVFFNSVIYPKYLSIYFLPYEQIVEIIECYSKFVFSYYSKTQFINNKRWKSLITEFKKINKEKENRLILTDIEVSEWQVLIYELIIFKILSLSDDYYKNIKEDIEFKIKIHNVFSELFKYRNPEKIFNKIKMYDSFIISEKLYKRNYEEIINDFWEYTIF